MPAFSISQFWAKGLVRWASFCLSCICLGTVSHCWSKVACSCFIEGRMQNCGKWLILESSRGWVEVFELYSKYVLAVRTSQEIAPPVWSIKMNCFALRWDGLGDFRQRCGNIRTTRTCVVELIGLISIFIRSRVLERIAIATTFLKSWIEFKGPTWGITTPKSATALQFEQITKYYYDRCCCWRFFKYE